MTYHSDTLAFKKSELLEILQAIDSGFSFDPELTKIIENNNKETLIQPKNTTGYKLFLHKKPMLSVHEAACIMTEKNPRTVDINDPDYCIAGDFISSAISANELYCLDSNSIDCIKNIDLKNYLTSQFIAVEGFTDATPLLNQSNFGNPTIQQAPPDIENLTTEITRLRNDVADKAKEIEALKAEIQQLESSQPSEQQLQNNCRELTPEQEIPHTRERGSVQKIIAVLVDMAGLPAEPYKAFGMLKAHAENKGMEIPSKDTTAKWTHNSN